MKRKILAIGLIGFASLFATGWFLGYVAVPKQAVEAQQADKLAPAAQPTLYVPTPPRIKGVDIPLLKAHWGDEFTPAGPNVQPKITKAQALNNALARNPRLKQATSIVFELGYLKNPGMLKDAQQGEKVASKIANPGLVWILVCEGVPSESLGPPGAPISHSNELNVVISAITGEPIETFTYR